MTVHLTPRAASAVVWAWRRFSMPFARHRWNIAQVNRRARVGLSVDAPAVGGVVHALSTAPVPVDERRGGKGWTTHATLANKPGEATTRRNIALFKLGPCEPPRNTTTGPILRQQLTPVPGSQATSKNRPLLINGTEAGGVIHALSTATVLKQSSRGGERVDNPTPTTWTDRPGNAPTGRTSPISNSVRASGCPPFPHRDFVD